MGVWDATHLVTTNIDAVANKAKYRVNSTVFFQLDASNPATWGKIDCGCSLIKTKEKYLTIDDKDDIS